MRKLIQKIYHWLTDPATTAQIADKGPGYIVVNFETKSNLQGVTKRWTSKFPSPTEADKHWDAATVLPPREVKYKIGVDGRVTSEKI